MKLKALKLTSLLSLLSVVVISCSTPEPEAKNIVFILADDLGWNQVGYHGLGDYYETPNIDRIAAEGIQFTDAYSASSICTPARVSLMTGKNPARVHITDYLPGGLFPFKPLKSPDIKPYLPIDEKTIAQIFTDNGYRTAMFGKWHLSTDRRFDDPGRFFDPENRGFHEVLKNAKPKDDHDPFDDPHHVEAITEHSIDFLERNKDNPFFLYVSHHVVHRPLIEEPEFISKYENKDGSDLEKNNPIMGAMIERMDDGIGRILDKLNELGLTENTIVIFYSDNGGLELLQSQDPLRGGKAMVFEGGLRVPLAIKWPGVVQAGGISNELVISDDLFPTMLEMLNIKHHEPDLDGLSLVPLLKGQKANLDREALYWHYPHYHHLGYKPGGAIRVGDFKLIEWYEESLWGMPNQISLYNLKDDIGETNDLSEEYGDKAIEMRRMLHQWRRDINAQEMTRNPHFDPEREGHRLGAI